MPQFFISFDGATSHQGTNVTVVELNSEIPSDSLNDNKMIEVETFRECGLLNRVLGHADHYLYFSASH